MLAELKEHDKPPAHYNDVPIQPSPVRSVVKFIKHQLFKEAYEPDLDSISDPDKRKHAEELNKRIKKAWALDTGSPFIYTKPVVPFLHGEPGHGKTTACKLAAEEFCRDVGMNFVHRPNNDYQPTSDDFIYIQMELAGENSSTTQGGLPSKSKTESGQEFTHKVPLRQIQMVEEAGFGFLVYDDAKNASPNIQNILMSTMEERAFQGNNLGRIAVAGTGNLGTDGTNVHQMSSANMTRMANFATYDTVGDFVERILTGKQDKAPEDMDIDVAGDAIVSFLIKNPDCFTEKPERERVPGTYACPRSWSKLLHEMRSDTHKRLSIEDMVHADLNDKQSSGYKKLEQLAEEIGLEPGEDSIAAVKRNIEEKDRELKNDGDLHSQIQRTVCSLIGNKEGKAGKRFSEYLYRRLSYGTDLMADSIIKNGKLTDAQNKQFIQRYSGQSSEARDFGHHMTVSLAEAASTPLANAMRKNDGPEIERIAKNFTKGLFAPADVKQDDKKFNVALDDGEINRALYFLMSKTSGKLKDNQKLRSSSTGYIMDSSALQSFLTGAAKEPTAAQSIDGERTRYDLLSDMLTNQKQRDAVVSDDLAALLANAAEEKAMTAAEVNQAEAQREADMQKTLEEQSAATEQIQEPASEPTPEPKPEPTADVEPDNAPVKESEPEVQPAATQSNEIDPFDQFQPEQPAPNKTSKEDVKPEDLPLPEKRPEDDLGFDVDDDMDLDLDDFQKAGGMGR